MTWWCALIKKCFCEKCIISQVGCSPLLVLLLFPGLQSGGVSVMETCEGSCYAWSWRRNGRVWASAWRGTGIAPASASSWSGSIPGGQPPATGAFRLETSFWRWEESRLSFYINYINHSESEGMAFMRDDFNYVWGTQCNICNIWAILFFFFFFCSVQMSLLLSNVSKLHGGGSSTCRRADASDWRENTWVQLSGRSAVCVCVCVYWYNILLLVVLRDLSAVCPSEDTFTTVVVCLFVFRRS